MASNAQNPSAVVLYVNAGDVWGYQKTFLLEVPVGGVLDNLENGTVGWEHYANTSGYFDEWNETNVLNHTPGGNTSWYCGQFPQYAPQLDAALVTPEYPVNGSHELHFFHWISAQTAPAYPGKAYDGGIVEMSLNGGAFQLITPRGGYPYSIQQYSTNPFPAGTPCYSGMINWQEAIFDLQGTGTVQFRFRFGSNNTGSLVGWFIDDVKLVKASDLGIITNLEAVSFCDEITLSWNSPGISDGNSANYPGMRNVHALEQYRLYRDSVLLDSTEALSYTDNLTSLPYTTYSYQVAAVFKGVEGPLSTPIIAEHTGVEGAESPALPLETRLIATYPNPFNPAVSIRFSLAAASDIRLDVFDTMGRQIAELQQGQLGAGIHEVVWNAAAYSSGIYLVRMKTNTHHEIRKILLLK
ncbi:MAG: T9SS type A sorting domain-containing protein [bacterium]